MELHLTNLGPAAVVFALPTQREMVMVGELATGDQLTLSEADDFAEVEIVRAY